MEFNNLRYRGFESDIDGPHSLGNLSTEIRSHDLRIATWNMNGIRSGCLGDPELKSKTIESKKLTKMTKLSTSALNDMEDIEILIGPMCGLVQILNKSDIICLQETRICKDVIEKVKISHKGHIWRFIASSSTSPLAQRRCNSYSGTALLIKDTISNPNEVFLEFPGMKYQEGRFIHARWDDFNLVNVYVPNSGTNDQYRDTTWHPKFLEYANSLQNVIICGDFNVARTVYDLSASERYPDTEIMQLERQLSSEKKKTAGFMEYEREWIEKFINEYGHHDIWRSLNPGTRNAGYTYKSNIARSYWRIDYIFIRMDPNMYKIDKIAVLDRNVLYSDHIPLVVNVKTTHNLLA